MKSRHQLKCNSPYQPQILRCDEKRDFVHSVRTHRLDPCRDIISRSKQAKIPNSLCGRRSGQFIPRSVRIGPELHDSIYIRLAYFRRIASYFRTGLVNLTAADRQRIDRTVQP